MTHDKASGETARVTRTDLPTRFLTVSNFLSLIRMALTIPFVLLMLPPSSAGRLWGAGIMVAAALTDKLDGWAARRFHQTSEWGKLLDPLADKIAVGAVLIVLLILGDVPLWFVALGVGRDVLILAGGVIVRRRTGILLPSNEFGKWTVGSVALVLFLLVLGLKGVVIQALMVLSAGMMTGSLILYAGRGRDLLAKTGN